MRDKYWQWLDLVHHHSQVLRETLVRTARPTFGQKPNSWGKIPWRCVWLPVRAQDMCSSQSRWLSDTTLPIMTLGFGGIFRSILCSWRDTKYHASCNGSIESHCIHSDFDLVPHHSQVFRETLLQTAWPTLGQRQIIGEKSRGAVFGCPVSRQSVKYVFIPVSLVVRYDLAYYAIKGSVESFDRFVAAGVIQSSFQLVNVHYLA